MSQRIDKTWLVFASIENDEHDRCVDLFERPDGTCGFEHFRRDPEDGGAWTPMSFHSVLEFPDRREALVAAIAAVVWLGEAVERHEGARGLLG
ncbi:MAG: hypothetical protein KDE49_01695 [Novosphingobium sp.]|nr:hypothetical protein [Novosphingobium sp.]